MKERESNFELLRIIAMLLIISGHLANELGDWSELDDVNYILCRIMGSASRISVNLFLMIGAWFMVDMKFKASRLLKIWGEVWIYCVPITIIMYLLGYDVSLYDLCTCFFPFWGRNLWFASVYMALILMSPILNKVLEMELIYLKKLVVLLFLFVSGMCTVSTYVDGWLPQFSWFMCIYILIGYYKNYMAGKVKKKAGFFIAGIGLYLVGVFVRIFGTMFDSQLVSFGVDMIKQYFSDYRSVPNFLCAFFIFIFFSKLHLKENKIINWLASGSFGVYIIHQVPCFRREFLWENIYNVHAHLNYKLFFLYYIWIVVSIYLVGTLIDRVRRKYIEPIWCRSIMGQLSRQKK